MKWVDVCVVEAILGGATLLCDWIEVHGDKANLKGMPIEPIVGRDKFNDKNPRN